MAAILGAWAPWLGQQSVSACMIVTIYAAGSFVGCLSVMIVRMTAIVMAVVSTRFSGSPVSERLP